jgi:predicted AAA+ superfamily ATPase
LYIFALEKNHAMSLNDYLPRICDFELQNALATMGAVLIEGAKWCGKTSTAANVARSTLFMQDPDNARSYREMADTKPSLLLTGENPRLIDEWQMSPVLWDAVRFEVDKRCLTGQFILTGSAVPADNVTAHTGTGRFARILMRPMSLYESNESNGTISLADLFDGKHELEGISHLSIEQIAFAICRGGFPATISKPDTTAMRMSVDYVEAIIHQDISRVDGVEKNPNRVRLLLRSLARNIATMASVQTILKDVENAETNISDKTFEVYYNALRRIFVIEDMPAWSPSLRSKTAIRTSPKRHFVDPSIATAVMRIQPAAILQDFEYFGFLFEALCARDLRIYAQRNDGDVFHYRDKSGLEVDMIVQLRDGRWGGIEVKLGNKQIEQAAENLLKLKEKIDTGKMREPSFLLVLTGGQFAYRRKDGVWIVPVGCLKD